IVAEWTTSGSVPEIKNLGETQKGIIGYIYYDSEGNELADGAELEQGKTYKVKAIIKEEYKGNYEFVGEDGETVLENPTATADKEFTVGAGSNGNNGGGIGGIGGIEDIENLLKELPLWQLIVSGVSIILIIAFVSKTISNESKRKNAKKTLEKKFSNYYAGAFLGLTFANWTVVACILMGVVVITLALMIISSKRRKSAEEELDDARDQAAQKKEEDMKMMFMSMMGGGQGNMQGQPQGVYMNAQPYLGADEIRGIVSETMTAMLPGMQQMLPQQASSNDEVINRLVENQELLMKKFSEQPRVVEKEVASSVISEEAILKIVAQGGQNDETIQKLVERSEKHDERIEKLMEKIIELTANQNTQPQVVEKIVEVPVEKIV
ncbi:MAG: hypothetical protein OSJ74_11685, partial [Clostridia bacterium]|nr:hypothetical protein [Clostridia bacterium]